MIRAMGLVLAVILLTAGRPAQAQMPTGYGGFGQSYTQPIPANSYVLDRWWMLQATPSVGGAWPYPSAGYNPYTVPATGPRRMSRVRRANGRFSSATRPTSAMPETAPLPTGSLYWSTRPGMPLYLPSQRYAAYGQGYGVSPYGSADYGSMYKGYGWGY